MRRYSQGDPSTRRHALPGLPGRARAAPRRAPLPALRRRSSRSRRGSRACSTTACRGSPRSAARSRAGWRWRRRRAGTSPTTRSTRRFPTSAATSAGTTAPGGRTSTRSHCCSSACGRECACSRSAPRRRGPPSTSSRAGSSTWPPTSSPTRTSGSAAGAFYEARVGPYARVQADGEHLPFADGAFDLVYCVAALHHALDLRRMVSELARVTRRGGARRRAERGHPRGPRERRGRGPGGGEGLRDQRARAHALRLPVGVRAGRPRRAARRARRGRRRPPRPPDRRQARRLPLVGRSAATWFAQTCYGYSGVSLFARKLF